MVPTNFSFLDDCFRECEIILLTLNSEATYASRWSVTAYQSTWWNIPGHLILTSYAIKISNLVMHMVTQPFHPFPLNQS